MASIKHHSAFRKIPRRSSRTFLSTLFNFCVGLFTTRNKLSNSISSAPTLPTENINKIYCRRKLEEFFFIMQTHRAEREPFPSGSAKISALLRDDLDVMDVRVSNSNFFLVQSAVCLYGCMELIKLSLQRIDWRKMNCTTTFR